MYKKHMQILLQKIHLYLIFSSKRCSDRQTDRQTLIWFTATLLTTVSPRKEDLFNKGNYENWSPHSKEMAEQRSKKDFDETL